MDWLGPVVASSLINHALDYLSEMTSFPTGKDSQEMMEFWVLCWTKVGRLQLYITNECEGSLCEDYCSRGRLHSSEYLNSSLKK